MVAHPNYQELMYQRFATLITLSFCSLLLPSCGQEDSIIYPSSIAEGQSQSPEASTVAVSNSMSASSVSDASGPGYLASATWGGYLWTDTAIEGSSITPAVLAEVEAPFCVKGSVAADAAYGGVAMLGVNLNQALGEETSAETVTPTGEGVNVSVSNPGGSVLRLQLQGPRGDTDPDDRWCAEIVGTGGFIDFSSFNTECWNGGGNDYAGEPLMAAILVVPGAASETTTYDFCLNSLSEQLSAGQEPASSIPAAETPEATMPSDDIGVGQGSISDQYGRSHVYRDDRDYVIQNNVWGSNGSQKIEFDGTSFELVEQNGTASGGQVLSYPSIWIGSNHGDETNASNLPIQVSSISSVDTSWSWSDTGVSGSYNAAYDVWFSNGASGDPGGPSGGFLMVWLYRPGDKFPLGAPFGEVTGSATINGVTWDIYKGQNSGPGNVPIINYVARSKLYELSFDLNDFITHAVGEGYVQNSWYLSNVFAGFEIWSGGQGLRTEQFFAIVK